ncbi:hypothetical protein HPB50_025390 [Hyalomma asiaticum]|uniref:Uncharacterized protein n=1 Tax=Hyalomma asiaticum TaxID=266040 RepID=A0ACB7TM22_HYAAI|nr:hypothetical protein HPB50_025390 [Hyalomma asiaticum]
MSLLSWPDSDRHSFTPATRCQETSLSGLDGLLKTAEETLRRVSGSCSSRKHADMAQEEPAIGAENGASAPFEPFEVRSDFEAVGGLERTDNATSKGTPLQSAVALQPTVHPCASRSATSRPSADGSATQLLFSWNDRDTRRIPSVVRDCGFPSAKQPSCRRHLKPITVAALDGNAQPSCIRPDMEPRRKVTVKSSCLVRRGATAAALISRS